MTARILAFDGSRPHGGRVRISSVVMAHRSGEETEDGSADERAVARFLAGDVTGFEAIVRRYSGMVFTLAARLVGPFDAEDVVQETFIRAWRGLESFRGDSSLKTWLYAIALNRVRARRGALARLRSALGARESGGAVPDFSLVDGLADTGLSPEENAARAEERRRLRKAVLTLPEEFRLAVVLRDLEGLSYEDVAAVLGVPIGTVRSRLARGRALLVERLS
ncbi:MAG: RNA polymerase sigma factor [Acidithiobacillales bacterium]